MSSPTRCPHAGPAPRSPSRIARTAIRWLLPTLAAFAGGVAFGTHRAEATSTDASPYAATEQLGRVLVLIENAYVDPVDRARIVNGAIGGMVSELDPHSSYMSPREFKEFQGETEGNFGGVGLEVDGKNDILIVIAPIEGSPAERAGVKSGDRIVAVDGEDASGASLDKVVKKLRGAPGTHVKLTVKRDKQLLTFDLTREVIHVASITSKRLDGDVAYVRIKQFQEKTHAELVAAVGKLRAEGRIAGVVLDLRNNPGGLVDEAAEVADEFMVQGTIYTMRHRGQVIEEAKASGGGALSDVPVVAIVNEWSASASELLVGALQDQKRAVVVGAHTFGKGSVQSIVELPGGAGMRLTTARYYTPSGHAIQVDGVHPDVVLESTRQADSPFQVTREKDLAGHLAGEGTPTASRDAGVTVIDAGPASEVFAALAKNVPNDPSQGSDLYLRVAYQTLRAAIASAGAAAK